MLPITPANFWATDSADGVVSTTGGAGGVAAWTGALSALLPLLLLLPRRSRSSISRSFSKLPTDRLPSVACASGAGGACGGSGWCVLDGSVAAGSRSGASPVGKSDLMEGGCTGGPSSIFTPGATGRMEISFCGNAATGSVRLSAALRMKLLVAASKTEKLGAPADDGLGIGAKPTSGSTMPPSSPSSSSSKRVA